MKINQNFGILYTLLVIAQVVLSNYSELGPYVMLSILPAMVLCIPPAVDWLSEGLLGLNAAALVPVALMRKSIIKIFLGEDLIVRGDRFSYKKNGFVKVSIAHMVCIAVFLGIYIILDGAGTLPALFCLTKAGVSLLCNFVLSIIVTNILSPDDRK